MDNVKIKVNEAIERCHNKNSSDWSSLKNAIKNTLGQYIYEETKRNPMILPVILEV